jgi:hypothetical protein
MIVTEDAGRRLEVAQARVHELSAMIQNNQGYGDWDGLRAANQEVLAAERDVAKVAGDEYAVELDFALPWSTGAPLPQVLANDYRTFLLFYLSNPDADWDGTRVRIVDPAADEAEPWASWSSTTPTQ